MSDEELAKVDSDLNTVEQKINLCNETLQNFPCVGEDEIERLSKAVGFLEACKPRMTALIESGMRKGDLTPQLLERCLQVNDKLLSVLEAERKASLTHSTSTEHSKQQEEEQLQDTNMEQYHKEYPSNLSPPTPIHEDEYKDEYLQCDKNLSE